MAQALSFTAVAGIPGVAPDASAARLRAGLRALTGVAPGCGGPVPMSAPARPPEGGAFPPFGRLSRSDRRAAP